MYADILINHPYARSQESLSYEVPEAFLEQGSEEAIKVGDGVLVPFQRGEQVGIVIRLHDEKPDFKTRPIKALLEEKELVSEWQMHLAEWISEYYFCSKLDVLKSMLPKHIWRKPKQKRKAPKATTKQSKKGVWHPLTPEQEQVVQGILKDKPAISLIHGITGAGKTEIYKNLIRNTIKKGQQALLLVPEISLTPQLLHMFEGLFENIAVIHSRVSDAKRASIWRSIQAGEIQLVIGSRSAVFSPFKNLGIIVMDEEHEWTYKQDQSPRYHCRDVAKKIIELTSAQLVLGSATPSIESMHEAKEGKARLFSLKNRVSGTPLPEVKVVDMKEELRSENYSIFSNQLEQEISSNLAAGKQTILFLNRRGSASSTLCRDCGLVLECEHCDTKLTYHARSRSPRPLVCHYCGRLYPLPSQCPSCQSVRIKHLGVGTQRVEAELKDRFPLARIARADRDTMSKKDSFKELHKAMSNHEVDILIGTQMIAKGWDLSKVSLIGVILADLGLHLPDFRAPERSFQLLTQVAGRAGRREEQGRVIIQSYTPEHPAIEFAKHHDYNGFYEQEIYTRKAHHFPPFSQLIKLIHVSTDKTAAFRAGEKMKLALVNSDLDLNGDQKHSIDVAPALIPRINGRYYWHAYVQGNDPKSLLNSIDPDLLKEWRIDVDPVHTV